jgi:hypothetical protein
MSSPATATTRHSPPALNIQDAIALQVASTLGARADGRGVPQNRGGLPELTGALDHVFRAYAKLWEMTRESEQEARRHLELARELNPGLAQAHLWLAIAAAFRHLHGTGRSSRTRDFRQGP